MGEEEEKESDDQVGHSLPSLDRFFYLGFLFFYCLPLPRTKEAQRLEVGRRQTKDSEAK